MRPTTSPTSPPCAAGRALVAVLDIGWGACLTAAGATAGYLVAQRFSWLLSGISRRMHRRDDRESEDGRRDRVEMGEGAAHRLGEGGGKLRRQACSGLVEMKEGEAGIGPQDLVAGNGERAIRQIADQNAC